MFRILGLFAVVFLPAAFSFGQVKTTESAPTKIPFEKSLQAVVVTTPNWNSVQGKAQLFERKNTDSKWKAVGGEFPVVVGKNGLGADSTSAIAREHADFIKKEGDGRAPGGLFPLTSTFGTADVESK